MDALAEAMARSWDERAPHWLGLLERLVRQGSGSDDLAGVDAVRSMLAEEAAALGLEVEEPLLPPEDSPRPRAAHLVLRRRLPGAPRVLLIAHLDTVFGPDDPFSGFVRDGEVMAGPGVGDIKGGAVAILAALAALSDANAGETVDLTVVMNSDEEVGSQSGRALLRALATGCDAALGFEPAFHPPGYSVVVPGRIQHVIERKGCGRFNARLQGVAAHAGGAHHLGASAIEAAARKIVAIHALTDASRGVTTNVGLVSGGRSVNTVAPNAELGVDFRYKYPEDGATTAGAIAAILSREEDVNPSLGRAVTTEIEPGGGALWPALLPTPASRALSDVVVAVSRELGIEAEPIARGGASDAAHAAAVGVPAICGLGPVTSGIHTDEERTSVPALRASALVAGRLLARLGGKV